MGAVYKIVNKVNNKQYIGSTQNLIKRTQLHLRQLRNNKHHSTYLQNAWNKYGEKSFTFIVLENVENCSFLVEKEQWWLDNSSCEYNMCKKAYSSLGLKRTVESRLQMSKAHLGVKHPRWRNKIKSKSQSGNKHWNYGGFLSNETRKQKSESMKRKYKEGFIHPRKGKKETKKQILLKKKRNLIPVVQLDLKGKKIKNWESATAAAEVLILHRTGINACLKNKIKSSGGYKWKYKTPR